MRDRGALGTAGAELFMQVSQLRGLPLCAAVLALLAAARLARGTRPVPVTTAVTEWGVSFVLLGVGLVCAVAGPDAGYRFRYDRLELAVRSSSQFLLLPGGWTSTDGSAGFPARAPLLTTTASAPAPPGRQPERPVGGAASARSGSISATATRPASRPASAATTGSASRSGRSSAGTAASVPRTGWFTSAVRRPGPPSPRA
ncbi:hypothetical protein [Pseudonocardia alni]|uniref:hypothetical protein n=1 Tax=Pseudonocardia alni TaxID=33907 RepID=UPI0012FD3FB5|nr:hypothetical protein [Pseudonocardia alni]